MDTDLTMQLVAARNAGTQASVQTAVLKKTNEMEMAVIDMVSRSTQSPPPAGQGLQIDKLA